MTTEREVGGREGSEGFDEYVGDGFRVGEVGVELVSGLRGDGISKSPFDLFEPKI